MFYVLSGTQDRAGIFKYLPTLPAVQSNGFENEITEYWRVESIQALIKNREKEGSRFVFRMASLSRPQSGVYTSTLMGRNYVRGTMTYAKGAENPAFKRFMGVYAKLSEGGLDQQRSPDRFFEPN